MGIETTHGPTGLRGQADTSQQNQWLSTQITLAQGISPNSFTRVEFVQGSTSTNQLEITGLIVCQVWFVKFEKGKVNQTMNNLPPYSELGEVCYRWAASNHIVDRAITYAAKDFIILVHTINNISRLVCISLLVVNRMR